MTAYMLCKKSEGHFVPMIEGIRRKNLVYGDKTILCKFELDRGTDLPLHHHPYEQTGYLLSGKLVFTIDGEKNILTAGDSWCIKENIEHGVKVEEDAVLVELFSPVREDFLE